MSNAEVFERTSEGLESHTDLARLEARGTVRLALKKAGLDVHTVSVAEMAVVLARVLPAELESRGIADGEQICAQLRQALKDVASSPAPETPDSIFGRLGG